MSSVKIDLLVLSGNDNVFLAEKDLYNGEKTELKTLLADQYKVVMYFPKRTDCHRFGVHGGSACVSMYLFYLRDQPVMATLMLCFFFSLAYKREFSVRAVSMIRMRYHIDKGELQFVRTSP